MAYDPKQKHGDGDLIKVPMAAESLVETEAVVLNTGTGMVEEAGVESAYRRFYGITESASDNSSGSAGDLNLETFVGRQQIGNVAIKGSGGSENLAATDRGKVVYCYGPNSYSVLAKYGGVPCGRLVQITSTGTAGDGRGDVIWGGIGGADLDFPKDLWNIVEDDFNGYVAGYRWDLTAPDSGTFTLADAAGGRGDLQASDGTVVANDEAYLASDGETWEFVANKPGFWEWEIMVTEANTDEAGVFVGLTDTVTMLADTTLDIVAAYVGAGFYKPHSDLFFHTSVNDGTEDDTQPSSQTAWATGTWYKLAIEYIPDATEATINYYIDGVLYDTKTFTVAGAALMHSEIGIKNESTNNNTLSIRRFYGRQAH